MRGLLTGRNPQAGVTAMKKATFIGVLGSLVLSGQASAQLVANGSFELPGIPPDNFAIGVNATGWSGPPVLFNGTVSGWPAPQHGTQYADIGNQGVGGRTEQVVSISVLGNYVLSWYDNTAYGATGPSTYRVAILDSADGIVASGDFSAFNDGSGVWQGRSLGGTLEAGSYTIQYESIPGGAGWDVLIDNVSLIPELEEYSLMSVLGLLVFAGYRRYVK